MNFGKKLRKLRTAHGLTQEALGDELGYSRQIISAWERGSHHLGLDKLETICKYFGVNSAYFLGEEPGIAVECDGEIAITETEDEMVKSKQRVHKGWKIVFGVTLTVLILTVLLIGLFIFLLIDFNKDNYDIYMPMYHFNFEPTYIAFYVGIFVFLITSVILFIISLKKVGRRNNRYDKKT